MIELNCVRTITAAFIYAAILVPSLWNIHTVESVTSGCGISRPYSPKNVLGWMNDVQTPQFFIQVLMADDQFKLKKNTIISIT